QPLRRRQRRRAVPRQVRARGRRLGAFRHLRLAPGRQARPAQGRRRAGPQGELADAAGPLRLNARAVPALSRRRVYAMLTIVVLLGAGNSIVGRAVRADAPPFCLALFRWTGALALLLPFAWARIATDWPTIRARWRIILLLGACG